MDRVVRNDDVGRQSANHNDVRVGSQTDLVNLFLHVLRQRSSHMDGTVAVEREELWWVVFFQKITAILCSTPQPATCRLLHVVLLHLPCVQWTIACRFKNILFKLMVSQAIVLSPGYCIEACSLPHCHGSVQN